jgi:hypothetical protein
MGFRGCEEGLSSRAAQLRSARVCQLSFRQAQAEVARAGKAGSQRGHARWRTDADAGSNSHATLVPRGAALKALSAFEITLRRMKAVRKHLGDLGC